ncbi:uncharacterized protein LOC128962090 [Oppia nitens]|uniref:uncharacterized protein LOC128962090 n=1 Tax=Oppia nitens TaxID=1686743 RepID=UPI0023DB392B|nr:uncharacterized protein LOC128962090 [Oppia nitens]
MKIIFINLIALLVLSSLVVSNEETTKDFCTEFMTNGNQIDFALHLNENDDNNNLTTDSGKYFFIGNTYWRLTSSEGEDNSTSVTIDVNSTGSSNWLSGNNYSMVWALQENNETFIYALQKNMVSIDRMAFNGSLNNTSGSSSSSLNTSIIIPSTDNFKPFMAWTPMPITYPIVIFFDNNNGLTKIYNLSSDPNITISTINKTDNLKMIEQLNKVIKLMAIIGQFTSLNNSGSILFTKFGNTIKYCYLGNSYNDITTCNPEYLKTLIDCMPPNLMTDIILNVIAIALPLVTLTLFWYLFFNTHRQQ